MQCELKSKMPGCAGSTSLNRPFFAALEAFCRAYCTLVGSHRSVRSVGPSGDGTARKLPKAVQEFHTYITNNAGFIPNYGPTPESMSRCATHKRLAIDRAGPPGDLATGHGHGMGLVRIRRPFQGAVVGGPGLPCFRIDDTSAIFQHSRQLLWVREVRSGFQEEHAFAVRLWLNWQLRARIIRLHRTYALDHTQIFIIIHAIWGEKSHLQLVSA